MEIRELQIPGARLILPQVFPDERGFFLETWRKDRLAEAGFHHTFVQDNFSRSRRGVLRGLHYQIGSPQGKLVHVTRGRIFDVAVDLRRSSPTFGQHLAIELSDVDHAMLYVPEGCAHGFLVLSEEADVAYRCTNVYAPAEERTIVWNDPELGIEWPITTPPVVSQKDAAGRRFADAEHYP